MTSFRTTLLALFLLPLAVFAQGGDEAEAKAAALIDKLGGKVTREPKIKGNPIVAVNLSSREINDATLKALAGLKHVRALDIGFTPVSDAGLKELTNLVPQLQTLSLAGTKITNAGLKELAAFKQLQSLSVGYTAVTDAGLKDLATLPGLQTLVLDGNQISEAGLVPLAALKQLKGLSLWRNTITD